MSVSIKSALENVKEIYMSDSALETLMSFERVIDELDVYAFRNWKLGELVAGPEYEKYFVTCTFMYPYKKMPDPRGGEQLLNYNCEVLFKKDELEYPIKPKSPDDFKPGTKLPKTARLPIWLVTITIPKKLIKEIQQGSVEVEGDQLDMKELEQAYENDVDEAETQTQDQQNPMDPNQQMPPEMPQQGGVPNGQQLPQF